MMDGYKYYFDDKLVTVWSAPNYCYRCGNIASILKIDENMNKVPKIFKSTTDTSVLKNYKVAVPYFL